MLDIARPNAVTTFKAMQPNYMWGVTYARRLLIQRTDKTVCYPFHKKAPRYTIAPKTRQRGNDEMWLDLL